MEIIDFSQEHYSGIAEVHNSLSIDWPERPRTPEAWAEVDRQRSPKTAHQRWVAVADGRVVVGRLMTGLGGR